MKPLDLGARGSATIGGNIATNAGGNQLIRYGMMREQVLGLEAVLADGTVVSSMNAVLKNNTGYDLKQLFIGSEGTLGIITRAVLRLRPLMPARNSALVATDSLDKLILLLTFIERELGGRMSAFEAMWNSYYRIACRGPHLGEPPLPDEYPFYVLIESAGADLEAEGEQFLATLGRALENGLVADAVLAQNSKEREAFWAIRDNIESVVALWPLAIFDISLPIATMESYLERCAAAWRNCSESYAGSPSAISATGICISRSRSAATIRRSSVQWKRSFTANCLVSAARFQRNTVSGSKSAPGSSAVVRRRKLR